MADPYLADLRDQIAARTAALGQDAARTRPAWTSVLGTPPAQSTARAQWQQALATFAAYRDQHQISIDDPAHSLGPYVTKNEPGYAAYVHANIAVVAAHRAATTCLSLRPKQTADPDRLDAAHRAAVDTYRALPQPDRDRIAAHMLAQLGDLWQGHPDDVDTGVTQPAYAPTSIKHSSKTANSPAVSGAVPPARLADTSRDEHPVDSRSSATTLRAATRHTPRRRRCLTRGSIGPSHSKELGRSRGCNRRRQPSAACTATGSDTANLLR